MAEYRSGSARAWFATFGLAAAATVQLLVATARAYVAVFAPDSQVGYNLSAGLGAALNLVALVVAATGFILWLRRAVANTLVLGSSVRLTVRDALLAWMIPLVNLFWPYRIVAAVYRANAVPGQEVAGDWLRKPSILPIWWGAWLFTSAFRSLGAPQAHSFESRERMTTWISVAGVPFALVAASAAIAVIWSIESRQSVRAKTAASPRPAFEPPPHALVDHEENDDEDEDDQDD